MMPVYDLLVGTAAAAAGAAVLLAARTFPTLEDGIPGPGLFPQVVGALLIATGAVLAAQGWRASSWQGLGRLRAAPTARRAAGALVVVGAGLVYAGLLPYLGFRISAAVATWVVMVRMGLSPWRALPAAAALTVLVYAAYTRLKVPLPPGPLGW